MKKKLFSILLALVMCLSLLPTVSFAEIPPVINTWGVLQVCANSNVDFVFPQEVSVVANSTDTCVTIPEGKTFKLDLKGQTIDRGLTDKNAKDDGYVFKVEGTLILSDSVGGGKIIGGNALNGGGIYVASTGTLQLNGVAISGNTASNNGGGVYVEDGGKLMMSGTSIISGNRASNNGGGVFSDGILNITGGTITKNEAKNGGGVYFCNSNGTTIKNVTITENNAGSKGGGIYAEKSYDLSSSVQLDSNTAGSSLHANLSAPNQIKSSSGSFDGLVNFFLRIFSSIFGR